MSTEAPDPGSPSEEEEQKLVDAASASLAEHFDSVLILVTRKVPGYTHRLESRQGNYYASLGAARVWVAEEDEHFREQVRTRGDD